MYNTSNITGVLFIFSRILCRTDDDPERVETDSK